MPLDNERYHPRHATYGNSVMPRVVPIALLVGVTSRASGSVNKRVEIEAESRCLWSGDGTGMTVLSVRGYAALPRNFVLFLTHYFPLQLF